jgi:hypothetical protein
MRTEPFDKVPSIQFAKDCLKGLKGTADWAYRQMQTQIE